MNFYIGKIPNGYSGATVREVPSCRIVQVFSTKYDDLSEWTVAHLDDDVSIFVEGRDLLRVIEETKDEDLEFIVLKYFYLHAKAEKCISLLSFYNNKMYAKGFSNGVQHVKKKFENLFKY